MVDDLAAPLAYDGSWLTVLGALTALPIVLFSVRALVTVVRRRTPRLPGAERGRVLAEIDAVVAANAAGRLAGRRAHARLSILVRDFVTGSGTSVDAKTLLELELGTSDERLVSAIRLFYDGTFRVRPTSSVADAAAAARSVVSGWTS